MKVKIPACKETKECAGNYGYFFLHMIMYAMATIFMCTSKQLKTVVPSKWMRWHETDDPRELTEDNEDEGSCAVRVQETVGGSSLPQPSRREEGIRSGRHNCPQEAGDYVLQCRTIELISECFVLLFILRE